MEDSPIAWVESHDNLGDHPKTFMLMNLLNIGAQTAVGAVTLLHHFTVKFAWKDGDLEKFGDVAIARGCKWEGDSAKFVKALRESGFLDGYKVHDWKDHAGKLIQDRIYNKQRRKTAQNGVCPPLPTVPTNSTNQPKDICAWFEAIWQKYPRPLGKKQAFRHFQASVVSEADWVAIQKALENYCKTDNVVKGREEYIQHGSTWFHNWRDWVDYKPRALATSGPYGKKSERV